jgi:hypothetical protein
MKRFVKASEPPVELRVVAKNPATRIQVVSESRRICLPEAATGEAEIELPPGQYEVLHWLHTSPVTRVSVNLRERTEIALERIVSGVWPRLANVVARFPFSSAYRRARTTTPSRHLSVSVEVPEPNNHESRPTELHADDRWPTLFLGAAGLPPSSVPRPLEDSDQAIPDYLPEAGAREQRLDVIVVEQSARNRVGLRRTVPVLDNLFTCVYFARAPERPVEGKRSARTRDWRFARYGLALLDSTVDTRELREDFEDGGTLIERLGEPGRVSMAEASLNRKATRTNGLACVAHWLLAARGLEWRQQPSQHFANQLVAAIPSEGSVAQVPDVQLLQLLCALSLEQGPARSTSYKKPFHLLTPVFSESWRALSRVPLANWHQRPILVDSTALRAAECASVGGVWFAWQTPFDPDEAEPAYERYDLTGAIDEALRRISELAESVRGSLEQPEDSDRYFTQIFRWDSRSRLERRILNYLTAPVDIDDANGSDDAKILEALSAEFGIPLPIIADAVVNTLRGNDNSSSPARKPVDSPSSAVAVVPEYEREHAYA